MAAPLSHITKEDLERLNAFALSDAPSSHENLSNLIQELARANSSKELCGIDGHLVVAGKGISQSRGVIELEAVLDFPDFMQHPVEQASACVALLRGSQAPLPGLP